MSPPELPRLPARWNDDEDDDWGSWSIQEYNYRSSCESASRWEPEDYDENLTHLVYPIEHGINCKGHRRYMMSHEIRARQGNSVPWPPFFSHIGPETVPVSDEYL